MKASIFTFIPFKVLTLCHVERPYSYRDCEAKHLVLGRMAFWAQVASLKCLAIYLQKKGSEFGY